MQKVLGDFIHALRHAGLPISSAETLDALRAAQLVGIDNAPLLKHSLGMTLTKRLEHRLTYEQIFDQYFTSYDQLKEGYQEAPPQDATEGLEKNAQAEAKSPKQAPLNEPVTNLNSPLAQQLMNGDMSAMQVMISSAATASGAQDISFITQVPMVTYRVMQALGDTEFQQELVRLASSDESSATVQLLRQRRSQLQQQVRDYVEQQYLIFNQNEPNKLRESNLQKVNLTSIDHRNYKLMGELVRKAAKRLASMHSRRRRITKRGLLDVRRTIATNAAYDGFLFHTKWKSTRVDRPKVMVVCDVSGSVSEVARFLLLFLYCLQDVLPKVRSFVFSSDMAEVTQLFEHKGMDLALAEVMQKWANLPSDYGKALTDFEQIALADIDSRTTVIMLGDARNNNEDGNISVWEEVYRRSQRVIWLNPEGEFSWDSADSIMSKYAPFCSHVETCNSLQDLNRILGSVLKRAN
ncbi:vWA domain-containing protein [Neptunomonas japonica]|uniref:vWA domain-containing protein n=1 Tax=Neptunomonas japonica TaxID=417574 RepID=UPI0003F8FB7E|nr:VWA domain-containing protein [Neptunomonas japonica]